MGVSLLLCLLPALLAAGSAQDITCQKCFAQEANCPTATQPVTQCTETKATGGCIIIAEESTLEGISSSKGFSRGCIADFNTGLKEALTFTAGPGWYVRINTKRCNDQNNCNSDALKTPQANNTLNGWQCPSCFAPNADTCTPVTVPCTGNENLCVKFAGKITKAAVGSTETPFAAQGCAIPSAKGIKTNDKLVSAMYTFTFNTASSQEAQKVPSKNSGASLAPGKVPFALFLPGVTGLLLVKLLS